MIKRRKHSREEWFHCVQITGGVSKNVSKKLRIETVLLEITVSKVFCLPSEKGSTLKGKNLLPVGANSFYLE